MDPRERLEQNTGEFIRMIEEYPSDKFNKKPGEESWSAAEIAEHIYRSEFGISRLFGGEKKPTGEREPDHFIDKMENLMLDTSRKARAFGTIIPTGEFKTKQELIEKFSSNRQQILEAYEKIDADQLCMNFEHPMFGYLTAQEWMLSNVFHTMRHMKQMEVTLKSLAS